MPFDMPPDLDRPMRVLIACEYSGILRRAFAAMGHDAWSCDLKRSDDNSNHHITGDVRDVLNDGWDLLVVAHPPCTRLCNSGVRWLQSPPPGKTVEQMQDELVEGAKLFSAMWNAPIKRIVVENPVMHKHAKALIENYEEFSMTFQPWQYGDNESKRTCLWIKGLPNLVPEVTEKPEGVVERVHRMPPGPQRAHERARFFPGVARAMASQWTQAWLAEGDAEQPAPVAQAAPANDDGLEIPAFLRRAA